MVEFDVIFVDWVLLPSPTSCTRTTMAAVQSMGNVKVDELMSKHALINETFLYIH